MCALFSKSTTTTIVTKLLTQRVFWFATLKPKKKGKENEKKNETKKAKC